MVQLAGVGSSAEARDPAQARAGAGTTIQYTAEVRNESKYHKQYNLIHVGASQHFQAFYHSVQGNRANYPSSLVGGPPMRISAPIL